MPARLAPTRRPLVAALRGRRAYPAAVDQLQCDDDPRSDAELIDAANRGDRHAFQLLYERHRDWVMHLALRFTGDHQLALDVLQETFIYLLGKFPGFELTCQLRTFLYPVVRHTALALRRKQRRMPQRDAGVADDARSTSPAPSVQGASDEAQLSALAAAMDDLSEGHREVVILRFADGLELAEIARAMALPLGTVKSRLHHALAALRENPQLKRYFEP